MSDTETPSIETLELQAELSKALTTAAEAERNLHIRLASRWEHRVYYFDGPVNFRSITDCITTLDDWRRLDRDREEKRMHIVFNGRAGFFGSVAMHDFIRGLRLDGFTITVEIAGRAAGQSALIVAAADHGLMTRSSWLQIDEVSLNRDGNTFDADNEIDFNDRLDLQLRSMLCERSKALTNRKIAARTHLRTWMVSSTEALAAGLIDDISEARPDILAKPTASPFTEALPAAETTKQELTLAYIRKMRAEAYLFNLQNRDRHCNALNNGVVNFIDTVTTEVVNKAKIDLDSALRSSNSDLTLRIYSNGGSVIDGAGFIDLCDLIRASGRIINTDCIGYAASMAGVMLQCGNVRTMGKNSWLLIHRVGSWFGPKTSEAKLEKAFCDRLQRRSFEILASRSIFTANEILERCREKDWWINAEDALKYGFIDKIR